MINFSNMLTTAAFICIGAVPVSAQSGFPESYNASVSGISIGQNSDAARLIIEGLFADDVATKEAKLVAAGKPKRSGDSLQESTVLHPVTQEQFAIGLRGSAVHEVTDRSFRTSYVHYAGAASIMLSSPVEGQHVEAIRRRIAYGTPLDPEAALAKIVETYGEPHARWGQRPMFLWGFKDGDPLPGQGDMRHATTLNNCSNPSQSPRFAQVERGSDAIIPNRIRRDVRRTMARVLDRLR